MRHYRRVKIALFPLVCRLLTAATLGIVAGCNNNLPPKNLLVETVNGYDFEKMVAVDVGTFTMGCTYNECTEKWDGLPTHQITLTNSYYIGKYEVTQGLWKAVMGSLPESITSSYSYGYGDDYPIYYVSWNDVQTFIQTLNSKVTRTDGMKYRLPTEAEWEYAGRGGRYSQGHKYSGNNDIDQVAWYSSNSGSTTHTVGTKAPNELDIYDMNGNVWEWVNDWYGEYSSSSQTNPTGPESGSYHRVIRGGSWYSGAGDCRVSDRSYSAPDDRSDRIGFRLVLSSS